MVIPNGYNRREVPKFSMVITVTKYVKIYNVPATNDYNRWELDYQRL